MKVLSFSGKTNPLTEKTPEAIPVGHNLGFGGNIRCPIWMSKDHLVFRSNTAGVRGSFLPQPTGTPTAKELPNTAQPGSPASLSNAPKNLIETG